MSPSISTPRVTAQFVTAEIDPADAEALLRLLFAEPTSEEVGQ